MKKFNFQNIKSKIRKCFKRLKLFFRKCLKKLKVMLDKFITYLKSNKYAKYVLMLVIFMIIIIIFLVVTLVYKTTRTETQSFEQYILGIKFSYKADVDYDTKDKVVSFKVRDYDIDYKDTPVYYKKEDKVLFGSKSSLIFLDTKEQYLLPKNSVIEYGKNYTYHEKKIKDFIVFNGDNLFFFSEDVKLYIDSKLEAELGKNSYCILWNDQKLEYFDYKTKTNKFIDINGNVSVSVNDKIVNINLKSITDNDGKEYLLQTNLKILNEMGDEDE